MRIWNSVLTLFIIISSIVLTIGPAGAVQVKIPGQDAPASVTLASLTENGTELVPAVKLCQLLNVPYRIDVILQRLYIGEGDEAASFLTGLGYYLRGGDILFLAAPARYDGGDFYVAAAELAGELTRLSGRQVTYQAATQTLQVTGGGIDLTPDAGPGDPPPIPAASCELIRRIVIDAGHGGHDPGARGNGLNEKDITLALALKLRTALKRLDPGLEIILTRSSDVFISLRGRTRIANEADGDLFISIHCNAARNRTASGFEIYVLSADASDNAARAAAALENAAAGEDDDVHAPLTILEKLRLAAYQQESVAVAGEIKSRIIARRGMDDRGVKSARFAVLRGALMPAVLAETAFISNPDDAAKLRSTAFQERVAQDIAEGVISYKQQYETACSD